jgi:hypothetical protein
MQYRRVAVVLAVIALAVTAGCLGGGDSPQTTSEPTPTATTTQPTPTEPEPTTTTPPTTEAKKTTTADADWRVNVTLPERVHAGELDISVRVTNVGNAPGTWTGELRTYRAGYPDLYDHRRELSTTLYPGEEFTFTVTVEPTATDDWPVFLEGERIGTVDVVGLSVGGGGGGGDTAEPRTPAANGSVSGDSRLGRVTGL